MASEALLIASVESKNINTQRGPGIMYIIKSGDGREFTTFDQTTATQAAQLKGQTATLDFNVEEKPSRDGLRTFTNYRLQQLTAGGTPAANHSIVATPSQVVSNIPKQPENIDMNNPPRGIVQTHDREDAIARAVALKAAVDLAAGQVVEDVSAAGLLTLAESLLPWLKGGVAPQRPVETEIPFGEPVGALFPVA